MENSPSDAHSDRCINPYNLSAHKGKNLRSIPKKMQNSLPQYSTWMRVCSGCRKYNAESLDTSSNTSLYSDENDIPEPRKKTCTSREKELEEMLDGLKVKFLSLPPNDPLRISILTIAPECWSVNQTAKEFNTTKYFVEKARKLKETEGILASPVARAGKTLSPDIVDTVRNFYESDENSRIMPNKKDVVTIKVNNQNEKKQKRLMLCDVKNLHTRFKKVYPQFSIGKSKFAELRPKWCILAGANGTHSVCICTQHQNFKTMFDAANLVKYTKNSDIPIQKYQDCFDFILCKHPLPACYLRECQLCPGKERFSDHLDSIFQENGISQVIFSIWQATDRCTLKKECLSTEDFIHYFCTSLETLIPHHFISKRQSEYIKNLKDNLKDGEVVIHTDFSENYAYIAQDAAQAFHYNNDQCTVHPMVCYYKSGEMVSHKCFVILSECTTHDSAAVYMMQRLIVPELKKISSKVTKIFYVSDGAKQHYKNKYQMCNLIHHKEDFGVIADWHFHPTAHGKGPSDGVGAILKREATRASLQAKPDDAILTAQSLVQWARNKFDNMHIMYYSQKEHAKMKKFLSTRFAAAPQVPKISLGHAFLVLPGKRLQYMKYSASEQPLNILQ